MSVLISIRILISPWMDSALNRVTKKIRSQCLCKKYSYRSIYHRDRLLWCWRFHQRVVSETLGGDVCKSMKGMIFSKMTERMNEVKNREYRGKGREFWEIFMICRICGNWEQKMLFYCFLGEKRTNLPNKAKTGLKMRFLWWLCNLFDVLRFKSDVIQFFGLDHGYWIMKNEESNHWFTVLLYSSARIEKIKFEGVIKRIFDGITCWTTKQLHKWTARCRWNKLKYNKYQNNKWTTEMYILFTTTHYNIIKSNTSCLKIPVATE